MAILNSEKKLGHMNGSVRIPNQRKVQRQKASGQSFRILLGFKILKAGMTKPSIIPYKRKPPGDGSSMIMC